MGRVRAKYFVSEKATTAYNGSGDAAVMADSVILSPVMGGSEENKKFFKATPSGKIELLTVNPQAASALEIGKEYYVDLTPADAPQNYIVLEAGASVIKTDGSCYKVVDIDGELQLERVKITE